MHVEYKLFLNLIFHFLSLSFHILPVIKRDFQYTKKKPPQKYWLALAWINKEV